MDLAWTLTPPKVAGWYWYRPLDAEREQLTIRKLEICEVVRVKHDDKTFLRAEFPRDIRSADKLFGEWAGPIPEPT